MKPQVEEQLKSPKFTDPMQLDQLNMCILWPNQVGQGPMLTQ